MTGFNADSIGASGEDESIGEGVAVHEASNPQRCPYLCYCVCIPYISFLYTPIFYFSTRDAFPSYSHTSLLGLVLRCEHGSVPKRSIAGTRGATRKIVRATSVGEPITFPVGKIKIK